MRSWVKQIGVWAGGLLGLGGLYAPAQAQFGPMPHGNGVFAADPQPATPAEFPNPAHQPPTDKVSPFSLRDDGAPNAFTELDCPPPTVYYNLTIRAEWLGWWVSRYTIPVPLVTTTTTPNAADFTQPLNVGALGQSGTVVLLGPGPQSYGLMNGGRATVGIAPGCIPPIEVSGFHFNQSMTLFNQGSTDGSVVLARPIQDASTLNVVGAGAPIVYLSSFPQQSVNGINVGGSGTINVGSQLNIWGVEANMFFCLTDNGTIQIDGILGVRYTELDETFRIDSTFSPAANTPGIPFNGQVVPPGFSTEVMDQFITRNQFLGGTLGLRTRACFGYGLTLIVDAKASLGGITETLNVGGQSTLTAGGPGSGGVTVPGGILAVASNSGRATSNRFEFVPEVNAVLSWQIFSCVRVFGGYNLMYWSNVVRPVDQLSISIDRRQVPTDQAFIPNFAGSSPTPSFRTTNFLANGFTVGVEIGF
jgi:hypothetical protein